jgi:hypothetical protein
VAIVRIDIAEERVGFTIGVKRINDLGTLAVTRVDGGSNTFL